MVRAWQRQRRRPHLIHGREGDRRADARVRVAPEERPQQRAEEGELRAAARDNRVHGGERCLVLRRRVCQRARRVHGAQEWQQAALVQVAALRDGQLEALLRRRRAVKVEVADRRDAAGAQRRLARRDARSRRELGEVARHVGGRKGLNGRLGRRSCVVEENACPAQVHCRAGKGRAEVPDGVDELRPRARERRRAGADAREPCGVVECGPQHCGEPGGVAKGLVAQEAQRRADVEERVEGRPADGPAVRGLQRRRAGGAQGPVKGWIEELAHLQLGSRTPLPPPSPSLPPSSIRT